MIARTIAVLAGLLLAVGGWQVGAAVWIHAKAGLAQVLIKRAWAETQDGAAQSRPWAWADTWPVAQIAVPRLNVDQIVLAGASGRTLAFGPGHLDQTAAPGDAGHSVISGHRDTHFAFLRDLAPAMKLQVQKPDGFWRDYRVSDSTVVDARSAHLSLASERPALTLVTCWPFDTAEPGFQNPSPYLLTALRRKSYTSWLVVLALARSASAPTRA